MDVNRFQQLLDNNLSYVAQEESVESGIVIRVISRAGCAHLYSILPLFIHKYFNSNNNGYIPVVCILYGIYRRTYFLTQLLLANTTDSQ